MKEETKWLWGVSMGLIFVTSIVYNIICLATRHIPTINKITLLDLKYADSINLDVIWERQLPIEISRLWDIFLVGILGFLLVKAIYFLKRNWNEIGYLFIAQIAVFILFIIFFIAAVHSDPKPEPFSFFFLHILPISLLVIFFVAILGSDKRDFRYNLFFSASMGLFSAGFLGFKIGLPLSFSLGVFICIAFTLSSFSGRLLKSFLVYLKIVADPFKEEKQRKECIVEPKKKGLVKYHFFEN